MTEFRLRDADLPPTRLRPMGPRVVLEKMGDSDGRERLVGRDAAGKGGIILPSFVNSTGDQEQFVSRVVAVGPGRRNQYSGVLEPIGCSVGDYVVHGKYSGIEVVIDRRRLLVLMEEDVIGVLEPDTDEAKAEEGDDEPLTHLEVASLLCQVDQVGAFWSARELVPRVASWAPTEQEEAAAWAVGMSEGTPGLQCPGVVQQLLEEHDAALLQEGWDEQEDEAVATIAEDAQKRTIDGMRG